VGWKTIPKQATTFEGDIILTAPAERTINVVDSDGRGIPGAKVEAYGLGGPASASPLFRDGMEQLRPKDGPLTATTGADGRATFGQLPRTDASFVASKPGLSEGYAFREQGTIRLTLSGTLTGPDGRPLARVKIVLFADFIRNRPGYRRLQATEEWPPSDDDKSKHIFQADIFFDILCPSIPALARGCRGWRGEAPPEKAGRNRGAVSKALPPGATVDIETSPRPSQGASIGVHRRTDGQVP
jgi:hypothetical protein